MLQTPFWLQDNVWHDHLLHRDTTMLEGVFIVSNMAVSVVVIDQEVVVVGEYIARRKGARRELNLLWLGHLEHLLSVVGEVTTQLLNKLYLSL